MDKNNLNLEPWRLTEALAVLGYEVPSSFHYKTEHSDTYLQAFEAKKDDIVLKIIPYGFEDIEKAREHNHLVSPRLVKTIMPEGVSLDELIKDLKHLI